MLLLLIELYFHSPDWSTSNILIFLCHEWKCLPAPLTKTSFFYGPHIQVEEVLTTIEHIFFHMFKKHLNLFHEFVLPIVVGG